MRKIFVAYAICFVLITWMCEKDVFSWDNELTHRDLTGFAASNSILNKANGDYLRSLGLNEELLEQFVWNAENKSVVDWLRKGALLEDAGSNAQGFIGMARYNNHFHNPLNPWGSAGLNDIYTGESSIFWAQYGSWQAGYIEGDWSWKKARDSFYSALTSKADSDRRANFAQTFKALGHQSHLIQDMAVPAHTRNDMHARETMFSSNPLTGDYYFETWAKKNQGIVNAAASAPVFAQVQLEISRNGFAPISQFIDSEQYTGSSPSTSSNWGLSEYTNANFVSDNTVFTENLSLGNTHYFPFPRYNSQCYDSVIEHIGSNKNRTYLRKKCDGEVVNHFVVPSPWWKYLGFPYVLDAATHKDYVEKLIPRAVGYSAALINYFFRGSIDIVRAPSGEGYVIQNNSEEDMSGTFELYYDKKVNSSEDERVRIWSGNYSLGKKGSGSEKSSAISFSKPTDAREPNKYMLVFRGKLGAENDAVAGKLVTFGSKLIRLCGRGDLGLELTIENGTYKIRPHDDVVVGSCSSDSSEYELTSKLKTDALPYNAPLTQIVVNTDYYQAAKCARTLEIIGPCQRIETYENVFDGSNANIRDTIETNLSVYGSSIDTGKYTKTSFGNEPSTDIKQGSRIESGNCPTEACDGLYGDFFTISVTSYPTLPAIQLKYWSQLSKIILEYPLFDIGSISTGTRLKRVIGFDQKDNGQRMVMTYEKEDINSRTDTQEAFTLGTWKSSIVQQNSVHHHLFYKANGITRTTALTSYTDVQKHTEQSGVQQISLPDWGFEMLDQPTVSFSSFQHGNRVVDFFVDVKGDEETLVYTFMKYTVNDEHGFDMTSNGTHVPWQRGKSFSDKANFSQRIVGIINISNPGLVVGHRQEFIIDDSFLIPRWREFRINERALIGIRQIE